MSEVCVFAVYAFYAFFFYYTFCYLSVYDPHPYLIQPTGLQKQTSYLLQLTLPASTEELKASKLRPVNE